MVKRQQPHAVFPSQFAQQVVTPLQHAAVRGVGNDLRDVEYVHPHARAMWCLFECRDARGGSDLLREKRVAVQHLGAGAERYTRARSIFQERRPL